MSTGGPKQMQMLETVATIEEDGTLTATAPQSFPRDRHEVVILLEEKPQAAPEGSGWPDMAAFRERLGMPTYPGNTVVEMREEERS
jgi:hypothetical protein